MAARIPAPRRSRSFNNGQFEASRRWTQYIRLVYVETPRTQASGLKRLVGAPNAEIFSGKTLVDSVLAVLTRLPLDRPIQRENAIKFAGKMLECGLLQPAVPGGSKTTFADDPKAFYSFVEEAIRKYLPNAKPAAPPQRSSSFDRTLQKGASFTRKLGRYVSPVRLLARGSSTERLARAKPTAGDSPLSRLRSSFRRPNQPAAAAAEQPADEKKSPIPTEIPAEIERKYAGVPLLVGYKKIASPRAPKTPVQPTNVVNFASNSPHTPICHQC
ncbi:hypothetical protein M3Y99_01210100 [Aphelenchoides fujianensis]|nr:hypothetical protein M3Y99_01210100 [Aphelenchoides fujianensis]